MNFNSLAMSFITNRLKERPSLDEIVGRIRDAATKGKIAFYPCNRCSNELFRLLKQVAPDAVSNIVGCFDKSPDAIAEEGIAVFPLDRLPGFTPSLTGIVVTSNVFYKRETETVTTLTGFQGPIINVSGVDLELSRLDPADTLEQINQVCALLADEKSRSTYLITWLGRLLNDEDLSYLFKNDEVKDTYSENGTAYYKQYKLDKLPDEIVKELYLNAYSLGSIAANPGDTVLDIGAFKGDTAVYFADRVGETGRVYSFEPVGANFKDLLHNVSQNGLDKIVIPVNKGCSSSSGTVRIATAQSGSPWAFISSERGVEDIEVTTIDEFVAEQNLSRVDFIKFDVEGLEYDVLTGGKNTIASFRPKMAVSLYHNLVDLVALPVLVDSLAKYDLYIRCKMEGPWSIFLYCEPNEQLK